MSLIKLWLKGSISQDFQTLLFQQNFHAIAIVPLTVALSQDFCSNFFHELNPPPPHGPLINRQKRFSWKILSFGDIWTLSSKNSTPRQDWEFAHRFFWANRSSVFLSKSLIGFSVQIAHYFAKKWGNEQFAQKKTERFAHFWWATWAIYSWLLILGEQPERIAHSRTFFVSNLSDLLTVALLSWATWRICLHHSLKKREWVNHSLKKKTLWGKDWITKTEQYLY